MGQLLDVGIGQAVAVAQLGGHIHGLDQLAAGGLFFGCGKHHLDQLGAQVAADHRTLASRQHGLVHVKLVGVDGALHHRLTQAVTGGDEHHIFKAGFGVNGEHDAGRTQVGAHHALHTGRQGHLGVGKALVHAVADGAVVVERGEHLFHLVQHVVDANHVQESFLLTGKGGVWQVFGGGRRTHGKRGFGVAALQSGEGFTDGFFEVCWERLGLDHGADFGTDGGQRAHVFGVQGVEFGVDAVRQAIELEELAEGVGGGGKAGGHFDAGRQLGNHLPQAGVFAADDLDVGHPQFFKGHDQGGRLEQVGHGGLQS